jgi:hypothetical protein
MQTPEIPTMSLHLGLSFCRLPINLVQAYQRSPGKQAPNETNDAQEQVHRESDRPDVEAVEGGRQVKDVCRELGISAATSYVWKSKYGGME